MMQQPSAILYVVATPIGHLGDFSSRAIETLKQVAVILAEDTRHSQKLLQHFGIHTPLLSCHEHNERERSLEVLEGLTQGKSYALISDAGTPVFSDPGAKLINAVLQAGFQISPVPGACAAISALSASGFEGLPFHFYGFLPVQNKQKCKILQTLQQSETGTLAFYESPHRLKETLQIFSEVWGNTHILVLAKELTKIYETIIKAPIGDILKWLEEDSRREQGEFVLLIENKIEVQEEEKLSLSLTALLKTFMRFLKLKEAVATVVELTGLPKNKVYERALALKNNTL